MKRIVVLNNPYINKMTTLNIDGDKTVVLEKNREGVLEYTQETKDNINFLDYTSQYCAIALKEDSNNLVLSGIIEHFSKFFVFRVILQSVWFLPLPDEKAIKFLSDILTGKDVKLGKMFSNYEDALNNIK